MIWKNFLFFPQNKFLSSKSVDSTFQYRVKESADSLKNWSFVQDFHQSEVTQKFLIFCFLQQLF